MDPSIFESLQKERVEAGDVIYIEANSGAVKVKQESSREALYILTCLPVSFGKKSYVLTTLIPSSIYYPFLKV